MDRGHFSQILKSSSADPRKEYARLFDLFFKYKIPDGMGGGLTLEEICAYNFINMPFRGTCVTLEDFNDTYKLSFVKSPPSFDIDYLIDFCEYSYNLTVYCQSTINNLMLANGSQTIQLYLFQVLSVIDSLGYMPNSDGCVTDFVPKDQAVVEVVNMLDQRLSYKVLDYNHHSLNGNIERKKEILLALANDLERQRSKLKQNCASLESELFFLFNNMNIRHNNTDLNSRNYMPTVSHMSETELEQWYDNIYKMCLLAYMELEHIDRKVRIKELKDSIECINENNKRV